MFRLEGGRPGDERGFIHKSFIGRAVGGLAKKFIPAVGVASSVFQGVRSLARARARPTVSRTLTARSTLRGAEEKELGRELKFGGVDPGIVEQRARARAVVPRSTGVPQALVLPTVLPARLHEQPGPCMPPLIRNPETGNCIAPTSPRGAELFRGEPTLGQYGAALIPGSQIVDRAVCPRGTQLGNDGLCYNKSAITNKQRMWPAGRKPLLSGGDMRAISVAARAGRRMELATKRLQRLGMMRKPTRRGVPVGHRARLVHASEH